MTTSDDFTPRAHIVADSISEDGVRLTSVEVTMHRFVLAELNTHRQFSRNSASSRAIPVSRAIDRMLVNNVFPIEWASEQKGMHGGEPIPARAQNQAREIWLDARAAAIANAKKLADIGVHKSIVNRLLEPYMSHTVLITSTSWKGFFDQRCSRLAQAEIRYAAEAIREARRNSHPQTITPGNWHLPYISADERFRYDTATLKKVSVARCARVSYLTHHGTRDFNADVDLYDRLVTAAPPHASPLEHVATPCTSTAPGNLVGWRQLRHEALDD